MYHCVLKRLTLRLHGFDFVFKHVKGENNISDYPSRHPVDTTRSYNETEQYVNFVAAAATPNAFSLDDVKMETKRDTLLQELAILIRSDQWYKLDKTPNNFSDVNALKRYRQLKQELTASPEDDLILKGHRIVLPRAFTAECHNQK